MWAANKDGVFEDIVKFPSKEKKGLTTFGTPHRGSRQAELGFMN